MCVESIMGKIRHTSSRHLVFHIAHHIATRGQRGCREWTNERRDGWVDGPVEADRRKITIIRVVKKKREEKKVRKK